ncbi:BREX-2 system phosphatase PglZ [Kitasatospora sp. NPDC004799]|uniref:BREX-2 system phosphatase PglZ n=1 Tax=Kitasatospora sp. NPDC004799 TaxID=3154460 RepID=UPI0033B94AB6
MPTALPQIGRRTIEALLAGSKSRESSKEKPSKDAAPEPREAPDRRLVLLYGRYAEPTPAEFAIKVGATTRRVSVVEEDSVLGIIEAWQEHRSTASEGDFLVVATGVDDAQLGWDVRAYAAGRRILTIENAQIVMQRFGVLQLDPTIQQQTWLLDALLDAEPADGWPRVGTVLTRDAALAALVPARLGLRRGDGSLTGPGQDTTIDADTLLAWSRTPAGPQRFTELAPQERAAMKAWLGETAGPAVPVLLSLVEAGLGHDAMALGLLASALRDPSADSDAALAVGGLFGQVTPRRNELQSFAEAVEGTVTRWIGQARTNEDARQRVLSVIDRADELAVRVGLTDSLRGNRFLGSSLTGQLRRVCALARQSPADAESALADLSGHGLAALHPNRVLVAEMAVRVARWLALPQPQVTSVAAGVRTHLADWGWVDRALTVLWHGDPSGDTATDQDLRALYEEAALRRSVLDEAFARRLATWAPHATAQQPGECLVIENVLASTVVPLLRKDGPAPFVLVLDGMSSAVAAQLGEETEREGWLETVPPSPDGAAPARLAAVSMFPSVTEISRASLLSGAAVKGGQTVETTGFTTFWRRHQRSSVLFHKAAIGGQSGRFLSEELTVALASDSVVGVVLNTIDDALDKGQEGRRTTWGIDSVTYLRELLAAARSYGRPVVLVADHGHVLERKPGEGPTANDSAASARWRTGTPAEGEVLLAGPRVFEGGGTIVAPWREDIRYTGRRAGYHGGAALAEVTVPVLMLVPSRDAMPKDWVALPREQAVPGWWAPSAERFRPEAEASAGPLADATPIDRPGPVADAEENSDTPAEPVGAVATTLGTQVVGSVVYKAQKEYVRKAPETKVVVAVIDALHHAGGTMSPAALVAAISATGRYRRNIDGFIAILQRLLNIEGYPVLGFIDSGHTVKLDVTMLIAQFQLEEPR